MPVRRTDSPKLKAERNENTKRWRCRREVKLALQNWLAVHVTRMAEVFHPERVARRWYVVEPACETLRRHRVGVIRGGGCRPSPIDPCSCSRRVDLDELTTFRAVISTARGRFGVVPTPPALARLWAGTGVRHPNFWDTPPLSPADWPGSGLDNILGGGLCSPSCSLHAAARDLGRTGRYPPPATASLTLKALKYVYIKY